MKVAFDPSKPHLDFGWPFWRNPKHEGFEFWHFLSGTELQIAHELKHIRRQSNHLKRPKQKRRKKGKKTHRK